LLNLNKEEKKKTVTLNSQVTQAASDYLAINKLT